MNGQIVERIRKIIRDSQGKVRRDVKVYDVKFSYRDPVTGIIKKTCKRGFLRKSDAEAYLLETQHQIYSNVYSPQKKITMREFLYDWLESYKVNLRESTYLTYKRIIDQHIVPNIGSEVLPEITSLKIDKFYAYLLTKGRLDRKKNPIRKTGLSATSVLHVHRLLYEAFAYAVRHRMISINPAQSATCPRPQKYNATVYTTKEIHILLEIAKEDSCLETAVTLAAICGMRRGEILALTADDVDFDEHTIDINKQYIELDRKSVIRPPKSEESKRTISAPQEVFDILRKRIQLNADMREQLGTEYKDDGLIVCYNNGIPIRPRTFTKRFSNFIKKHEQDGLGKIRFHDLRHSAVTMMINAGVPLKTVSSIVGHSNINTTATVYAHTLSEAKKKAALQIGQVLFSKSENNSSTE